ncbi:MAG TPA: cyclic nucleotide-binding domain-containing protein [Dehalococcoidia bacterium]|nr:cyclic nucleotide-binding domain-containing protein [Dehalococcoidia bacterium]
MTFDRFFNIAEPEPERPAAPLLFLSEWSEAEWARLLAYAEQRPFRAGDLLIRAGEVDRSLLIIGAGTLDVFVPDGDLGVRLVGEVQPGEVIGEVAFFDGSPRSASVRAATDGEVRVLSREAFDVFAAYEPVLARTLLLELGRVLAVRLRAVEEARQA